MKMTRRTLFAVGLTAASLLDAHAAGNPISTRITSLASLPNPLRKSQKFDWRGTLQQYNRGWIAFPGQTVVLTTRVDGDYKPEKYAVTDQFGIFTFNNVTAPSKVGARVEYQILYRPIPGYKPTDTTTYVRVIKP